MRSDEAKRQAMRQRTRSARRSATQARNIAMRHASERHRNATRQHTQCDTSARTHQHARSDRGTRSAQVSAHARTRTHHARYTCRHAKAQAHCSTEVVGGRTPVVRRWRAPEGKHCARRTQGTKQAGVSPMAQARRRVSTHASARREAGVDKARRAGATGSSGHH